MFVKEIFHEEICYNWLVASPILARKGGVRVELVLTFLISVAAGVTANLICKWLDRDDSGNQPKD